MPIEYSLAHGGSVIHVKVSGRVTTADMMAYLNALEADPEVQSDHISLFDGREVKEMALDDDHFQKIAEKEQGCPHKLIARKLAFVVSDIESFKLSVRWIQRAEAFKESTMVFNDLESAKIWLGLRR
jgi:hypothetical protein